MYFLFCFVIIIFCCLRRVSCNTYFPYLWMMCIDNARSALVFYTRSIAGHVVVLFRCLSKIDSELVIAYSHVVWHERWNEMRTTNIYYLFARCKETAFCPGYIKLKYYVCLASLRCYFIPCNIHNSLTKKILITST